MVQKRVLGLSIFLLIFIALGVQAFGGGGGGGGGGTSSGGTYVQTPYVQQGGSVTIGWSAPAKLTTCEDSGATALAICHTAANFQSMSIAVYDSNTNIVASWTQSSNSGSLSWTVPSNAPLGTYKIIGGGNYDNGDSSGSAYEVSTGNNVFVVTAGPREYSQGQTVVVTWQMSSHCTQVQDQSSNYQEQSYHCEYQNPSTLYIQVNNPSGTAVYTCSSGSITGQSGGACMYTIAGNAPVGRYTISANCPDCEAGGAADSSTGRNDFYVVSGSVAAGNNPGDSCGTGNTCNNGLTCQNNVCKNTNVGSGGTCNSNSLCGSNLQCTNSVCVGTSGADATPNGQVFATEGPVLRGYAQDGDCIGPLSSTYNGCPLDVHVYMDGPAGSGAYAFATVADKVYPGTNKDNIGVEVPVQYQNGQQHSAYIYALGKDTAGNNNGNNPLLGIATFTYTRPADAVTCNTFTYSAWSTCSFGQQSRTLTSSGPAGCTGGSPQGLTNSCQGSTGNSCTVGQDSQCASGLTCQGGTCQSSSNKIGLGGACGNGYVCQDQLECLNNICVKKIGDQCTTSVECGNGRVCDPTSLNCKITTGGGCTTSTQCQTGQQCVNSVCTIVTQINSVSWTDMNNGLITTADKNDTVQMTAVGTYLSGKQITYEVCRTRPFFPDDCSTINPQVITASTDTVNSNVKISTPGTYYFKASTTGSSKTSSNIGVSDIINNNPPVAVITSPNTGAIYYTGGSIAFTHSSYDVDDVVASDTWKFGDGSTGSGKNAAHTYSSAGQKIVSLEVTDSRGAKASQTREISLANPNGYTLFVGIEKPLSQEAIKSNNLVVDYSGRTTYVINTLVSGSPCTVNVTCVQGQCPTTTVASPACSSTPGASVAITGGQKGYEQLAFNWTFKEGSVNLASDAGIGKVSGTKGFSDYGKKNISLKVSFQSQGLTSTLGREFNLFNQRQCSSSGTTWYELNNGFITKSSDTLSTTACSGLDKEAGTDDDCCPVGFKCSVSGSVGCIVDEDAEMGCSSYTSSDACSVDSSQRARNEKLWDAYYCGTSINGQNILCSCSWENQTNACKFGRNKREEQNPINGTTTTCSFSTVTSECVNGYQNVQVTAIGDSQADPQCVSGTYPLPCGRPVVALSFIGNIQIIAIIIVIVGIYLVLNKLNKKTPKSRKR